MTAKKESGPLGKNLRHLRNLWGVSRPDVARALGLTDNGQALYALESRNSARSDLAPALANYFDIDLELLITTDLSGFTLPKIAAMSTEAKGIARKPTLRAVEYVDDKLLSSQRMIRLMSLFAQATDEGQQIILDVAEAQANAGASVSADQSKERPT